MNVRVVVVVAAGVVGVVVGGGGSWGGGGGGGVREGVVCCIVGREGGEEKWKEEEKVNECMGRRRISHFWKRKRVVSLWRILECERCFIYSGKCVGMERRLESGYFRTSVILI